MKAFHTVVSDLRQRWTNEIETFPVECGWADEAVFFVTVENDRTAPVDLRVQISPDGLRWLDEGGVLHLDGTGSGFVRVHHFGGFLRLAGSVVGDGEDGVVLTVRAALKG